MKYVNCLKELQAPKKKLFDSYVSLCQEKRGPEALHIAHALNSLHDTEMRIVAADAFTMGISENEIQDIFQF